MLPEEPCIVKNDWFYFKVMVSTMSTVVNTKKVYYSVCCFCEQYHVIMYTYIQSYNNSSVILYSCYELQFSEYNLGCHLLRNGRTCTHPTVKVRFMIEHSIEIFINVKSSTHPLMSNVPETHIV